MITEDLKIEIEYFNSKMRRMDSINFINVQNIKHFGMPQKNITAIDVHCNQGFMAVGIEEGGVKLIGKEGSEYFIHKNITLQNEIKYLKFVTIHDYLITIDINENFNIYYINDKKSIYQSELNFKCTCLYIPNFAYEGYLNNFVFFGSQNGDTHVFNLEKLKFENFSIKSIDIKNFAKKNKINFQIFSDLNTVKKIILHPRDFNTIFIIINNIGIILYDLEEMCVADIYHTSFFITDFEVNYDGSEFIISSPTEIFIYRFKDKKYHQIRNIKVLKQNETDLKVNSLKWCFSQICQNIIIIQIGKNKKNTIRKRNSNLSHNNSFSSGEDEKEDTSDTNQEHLKVLFGTKLENTIELRFSSQGNKIKNFLFQEIYLSNHDLEQVVSLSVTGKINHSDSLKAKFIILTDQKNNFYFYNLNNIEVLFSDLRKNSMLWKNILMKNSSKNKKNIFPESINEKPVLSLYLTKFNKIFGMNDFHKTSFHSIFDSNNSDNIKNFVRKLIALSQEKELAYLNEKMNILNKFEDFNIHENTYYSSFLIHPLFYDHISFGNLNRENLHEEFHSLLITCNNQEILFWILTSEKYILIFKISINHIGINSLISSSIILDEQDEDRNIIIRRLLFQENDSLEIDSGVCHNPEQPHDLEQNKICSFDLNFQYGVMAISTSCGSCFIFRFEKELIQKDDQNNILTVEDQSESEDIIVIENENKSKIYEGFICTKQILSRNNYTICFSKILNSDKGCLLLLIDINENFSIYNLHGSKSDSSIHNVHNVYSSPSMIYEFSLESSEADKRESLSKNYSYQILEREINEICYEVNLIKYDNQVLKFILFSDLNGNFTCQLKNNPELIFKNLTVDTEGNISDKPQKIKYNSSTKSSKGIKKLTNLMQYTNSFLFSINFEQSLHIFNSESFQEVSLVNFDENFKIISHNINIFKNDVYISVLTLNENKLLNVWLYSVPDMALSFTFQINVDLNLDGHMVIVTSCEYIQAWLTYVEPEENFDRETLFVDELRHSKQSNLYMKLNEKRKKNFILNLEKNVKIKNRSIFKSQTTVSDSYAQLLKNISKSNKFKNEISRDSITKTRTSQIILPHEK